jgi:upstream activation factor subunit UAF30
MMDTAIVDELKAEIAKLRSDLKKLQKVVKNMNKDPDAEVVPKKPSGFAKPSKLSEDLTTFLGVAKDTELARTEVTKMINKYVKENSLQKEDNKRVLILDEKLKTIITREGDEDVTFFNLQKYMSKHFIKEQKATETVKTEDKTEDAPPSEIKKVVKKVTKKVVRPVKA